MTLVFAVRVDPSLLEALRSRGRLPQDLEPALASPIGSAGWLRQLAAGTLPTITVRGRLTRVNLPGVGGTLEFEMQGERGEFHRWSQSADTAAGASLYEVGRPIEVDLVREWFRAPSRYGGAVSTLVIRIRIGEAA